MLHLNLRYCFIVLSLVLGACQNQAADCKVADLVCYQAFDSGYQTGTSFSWKIQASGNWLQGAYQVVVSDSEKIPDDRANLLWDSGKIISEQQLFVPYEGKKLASGEKYYCRVRVWEKSGNSSPWSKVVSFVTPLQTPEDWKANWITYDYQPEMPAPLFRKEFSIQNLDELESAQLFICGLGYYEAFLNGRKIGERVLEPAQTNYEDYSLYSVYDLPGKEIAKKNVLGVMLGNGWYNQNRVWTPAMAYGPPLVIAQLVVKYKNGASEILCTDESWKWHPGPVVSNNIYAGEVFDANLEVAGWSMPGLEDTNWRNAKKAVIFPPKLVMQNMEPMRRMGEIQPVEIFEPSSKTWVFDFGQNFAGWVRLRVKGVKGQKITLRFAEELDQNHNIDPTSTGVFATKVVQTDQYTCKGGGIEIWEPRFTYHGFRYAEVTGLESKPAKELLTGIVVYSSMKKAGEFSCSDSTINRLHDLALWTIKSNVHGIPTDCPHRERCGWTGDAHTLAASLTQNFDARLFLTKYLHDMRSSARNTKKELYFGLSFHDRSVVPKPAGIPTMIVPGKRTSGIASPDWGTAATQIPWHLYQRYGDQGVLQEFYPDMKVWVDYIADKFKDGIVNHGLGDWCPPGGNAKIDCPVALSSTAFHYLDLTILTRTAQLLGYTNDGMYYANRMTRVKERFNQQFFDAGRNSYGGQTANVLAIQLGLVPEGKLGELVKSLRKDIHDKNSDFIQTGIFGLGRIFPSLTENGADDLAYSMLTKTGEHSFAYMWEKYHATTLWEVLPVDDSMGPEALNGRSHSHPMNAGYDEWFFRGIAGIHPDERAPGFKRIIFRPYYTSKLQYAHATYESPYGRVLSDWKWEGNSFHWEIQVPANSGAEFYFPKLFGRQQITVNGAKVESELIENIEFPGFFLYKPVGSGRYAIRITNR